MTISGPQSSQVSGCELLLLPYDTITHLIHGVTVQVPGLWIRVLFFRIRIQSLMLETNTDPDPEPIRIQGFNDQKLKKN
jgi:hypothetical protein